MDTSQRIGIIDIGSNSVRLVIYEFKDHNTFRTIDEFKHSARLSAKIGPDGKLPIDEVEKLAAVLSTFSTLCEAHQVTSIRAVATAAIRNAPNSNEIVAMLNVATGLSIDVLSGDEEARLGFLGMINSINVSEGLLVDIGGGSTEVTLFRNRERVSSISFPFGAVNTTQRFATKDQPIKQIADLVRAMIEEAARQEPWFRDCAKGMPLIGIGGTMRTIVKIHQRRMKYPLWTSQNHVISPSDMDGLAAWLLSLPAEKRKKIDGISKDRADIIGAGLLILLSIFHLTGCSSYITSAYGLRDGLLSEAISPESPRVDSVLEHSIDNMLNFQTAVQTTHLQQVRHLAEKLFTMLIPIHGLGKEELTLLRTASMLYKTGTAINYSNYEIHTFYTILHSRLNGLTHREIVLCAAIASYSKKHTPKQLTAYTSILLETDFERIMKLGILLKLAISLKRNCRQVNQDFQASLIGNELYLQLCGEDGSTFVEIQELNELKSDLKKVWKLQFHLELQSPNQAASTIRS